jgi:putative acetyltransferase
MLEHAEAHCRDEGFHRIVLSTSSLQVAALKLYKDAGYRSTRTELADALSNKTWVATLRVIISKSR